MSDDQILENLLALTLARAAKEGEEAKDYLRKDRRRTARPKCAKQLEQATEQAQARPLGVR